MCRPPCEVVNWNVYAFIASLNKLCRPPCEVVNWNPTLNKKSMKGVSRPPCEVVNWNKKPKQYNLFKEGRPPCEVVNWNSKLRMQIYSEELSTSLWGRELKYFCWRDFTIFISRPPCEVVNWNIGVNNNCVMQLRRPPCEVVNWNKHKGAEILRFHGRPPCEVVNWNTCSTSNCSAGIVDLLVRSWIEMIMTDMTGYRIGVDLLVRSWIEMRTRSTCARTTQSTSLWGRELKYLFHFKLFRRDHRRPPCEVVNWNANDVSSTLLLLSRPPCEVVNWNVPVCNSLLEDTVSTSLWGRELK